MGLMDGLIGNAGKIDPAAAHHEYARLLGHGEQVHAAYQLVRDAFLFTNRRLLMVDKQGLTGRKIEYHSVPVDHPLRGRDSRNLRSRRRAEDMDLGERDTDPETVHQAGRHLRSPGDPVAFCRVLMCS